MYNNHQHTPRQRPGGKTCNHKKKSQAKHNIIWCKRWNIFYFSLKKKNIYDIKSMATFSIQFTIL